MADDAEIVALLDEARTANDQEDWVAVRHPETDGVAIVSRESFDQPGGHASKGWELVTPQADRAPRTARRSETTAAVPGQEGA